MNEQLNVETRIKLNKFSPRSYQLPLCDALENKGYKKIIAVLPRRAGKDIVCWNLIIRAAINRVGSYFYVLPTFSQARRTIWDSINNDGQTFLDYIPKELVDRCNSQQMKITLVNGSIIQLLGSDTFDNSLVGTNPLGIVFSEYALQDPRAYQFSRPILSANGGFAIFISTPRGKNHLYDMYQVAMNSKEWFVYKLTLNETRHISFEEIEKDRDDGLMSEDLIQQEYFTSFDMGIEGAYYTKILDKMRLKGQIGFVPWESGFKVHTSWDIGVRDSTSIIFFQTIGTSIRLIDYYENSKVGLDHYAKVLFSKDYLYGKHIAPHDIRVQEFGTGMTRVELARKLGIEFTIAPDLSIMDGIEAVRSTLTRMWIDEKACDKLIKCLENYRQEFDAKKKVYKSNPLHNFASHAADAMRYLCISLPKTSDSLSARELDERFNNARYGGKNNMDRFFRDDVPGRY